LEYPGRFRDPRDGGSRKHGGADLYAPIGTNVYAVKGGTVIQNPYKFYRGSYAIEINHGNFVAYI
jgi:murein DD-endopeptidase MepM/ murein hydrolase activator NlpD